MAKKKNKKVKPFQGKFIVGTPFIYGWDFCWSTDDEKNTTIPIVYDTREEAEKEIKDDIESIRDAIKSKDMDKDSRTKRDDYIIAKASMDEDGNVTITEAETTSHFVPSFNIFTHY